MKPENIYEQNSSEALVEVSRLLQVLSTLPLTVKVVTNSALGLLLEFTVRDITLALGDLRLGLLTRHFNYYLVRKCVMTLGYGETNRGCKQQHACR